LQGAGVVAGGEPVGHRRVPDTGLVGVHAKLVRA
jgi:hypothetical protein